MGEFSAYESESGLPVRELTAENCGLVLLGAPKAVFERSAWLRESALPIGQHSALEQRLAESLPVVTQLGGAGKREMVESGFLI